MTRTVLKNGSRQKPSGRQTWWSVLLLGLVLTTSGCPDSDESTPVPGDTQPPATTATPSPTDTPRPTASPSPPPDTTPPPGTPTVATPEPPTPSPIAAVLVTPDALEFGVLAPGDTTEASVTVENQGEAALSITPAIVGDGDVYRLTDPPPSSPLTVLPGTTATITVTFAPVSTGDYSAVLTLETNDPSLLVTWVSLHGVCSASGLDADQDGFPDDVDCDDSDAATYPGAEEQCDGSDQNCNGVADDGLTFATYFEDQDGDGYGNYAVSTTACRPVTGFVPTPDGMSFDCDDQDGSVHPNAPELCDGVDQNCDGQTDEGVMDTFYQDTDEDGYGDPANPVQACDVPAGATSDASDCDDTRADAHPGAPESCNGADDDCDGVADDGVTETYFADQDGDGYGDPANTVQACSPPAGYVADSDDCDDHDQFAYPGATEQCNGRDDDCDCAGMDPSCVPEIDEGATTTYYLDADGDGYGTDTPVSACHRPPGYALVPGDCDDTRPDAYPGADEICNDADDDCDGRADEGVLSTFYLDEDRDGQGDPDDAIQACDAPAGYVASSQDCDDADPNVYLGAQETCNGADDDCDTVADDGVLITFYLDDDGDGFGGTAETAVGCDAPSSAWVDNAGDCDDADPQAYPGAREVCGDPDRNCDGETAVCASCREYLVVESGTEDGVYWIDPEANGGSFPVYCDMTTEGGGWTMVYKATQGISGDAYDLWTGGPVNEDDESLLTVEASPKHYVSRIPNLYWNQAGFEISRARIHLYTGGALDKFLDFDAQDSTSLDWFSPDRLAASSWTDILSEPHNFFSIEGDTGLKRRFFIQRNYNGCSSDAGWLAALTPGGGCSWELATLGQRILYAPGTTYVNWTSATNDGSVGFPDVMAVFVR